MTTPSIPCPTSWRNGLALIVSTILGAILTVLLSPFLLAAAFCLWTAKHMK